MELHAYLKNGTIPLKIEIPSRASVIECHVLKTKSGIDIEVYGEKESITITVGERSFDCSVRDGMFTLDGWIVENLIKNAIEDSEAL